MKTNLIKIKVKRKIPGFMGGFSWEFGYIYAISKGPHEATILATSKSLDVMLRVISLDEIKGRNFVVVSHSIYESKMIPTNVFTLIHSSYKNKGFAL